MICLDFAVSGLMLKKKQYTYLVAGTKNCISIKVKLDRHWQDLEVFAVCYRDNKEYPYAITNGECLIADMAVISTSGEFKLKLLGSTADGNVVMTTNVVTVYINDNKFSGAEGGELEYPTSDYLAEVLAGSKQAAEQAKHSADAAGESAKQAKLSAEQVSRDVELAGEYVKQIEGDATQVGKLAQQVSEQAEQVNGDAEQVASDKKSVTELASRAVKAAGNAQTYMEQTGQIKADAQTMLDNASQAMADVIGNAKTDLNGTVSKAKADIDAQGAEIITQATAQADRAQGAADGIRDTADTLQADNEHLKAGLKHANRRISVLYDLGKGITHRYETDSETAYSKDIPSGAKVMDVKMLGGKSVVGNNQISLRKFDKEVNGVHVKFDSAKSSITLTGTLTDINYSIPLFNDSIPITPRHKYYKENQTAMTLSYRVLESAGGDSISWSTRNAAEILTAPDNAHFSVCYIYSDVRYPGPPVGTVFNETFNAILVDLTQMFGAGNEPTLEQCREIFANDYYPYNAGTLTSADVTAVQVGDKVIPLPNSISLKSAGSVYDSLEFYEQDGKYYQKHTQRVGVVDLGTLPTDKWFNGTINGYRWRILNWTSDASKLVFGGIRNILCSAYDRKSIKSSYSENPSMGICVNNTYASAIPAIDIDDGRYTNLNDFIASLPGVLLYYELATPIVTVTEVDNRFDAVDCKAGDKITFVGNSDYHLPVPNEEEYLIALNEVTA